MSATLTINREPGEHAVWLPSSVMFDTFVEEITRHLDALDSGLATEIRNSTVQGTYGHLDHLSSDQMTALLKAVEDLVMDEVPSLEQLILFTPNDETFIRAKCHYLSSLYELKTLIYVDNRVRNDLSAQSTILVSKDIKWTAPGWTAQLTAELLYSSPEIQFHHRETALMLCYIISRPIITLDWSTLAVSHFCAIATGLKNLSHHFKHTDSGHVAYGDKITPVMSAKVRELCNLISADPRTRHCEQDIDDLPAHTVSMLRVLNPEQTEIWKPLKRFKDGLNNLFRGLRKM